MKFELVFIATLMYTSSLYTQGYYPLQIGNVWEYQDCYDSTYEITTHELSETTMSNGLTYVHLRSDHELFDQYFREVNDKIYEYSTYDSTEDLWYDFALATYSSNVIYVGGFGLVARSSDYGVTWSTLSDGIRGRFVNKITFDDEGYCYVGIMRGGVYRSVQPVSAVEGEPTSLPSEYSLGDAYPNPFNPAMLISFGIAKRSHVKLQVFNLLGQLITTLVNEDKHPGTYTATWDASTRPSGLYFYRMTAGEFVQTKKAILLR